VVENREEGPRNGDGARDVALGVGKRVCGGGGFEEEETEEHKHLCPYTRGLDERVHAECLKSGENNQDGRESMVQREREVDPEFVIDVLTSMVLFDNVVDVAHGAAHEKSENERNNVVLVGPNVDVNASEDREERETPADPVNNGAFAVREELVDNVAEEEQVDQRPNTECPRGRSKVRLLACVVNIVWAGNRVDIGSKEEDVNDDVHDLEEDTIFPIISHC